MDYNNDGSNPNDWDKWNSDASHNSYYRQPTHSPHKGKGFEYASFVCGIVSLAFVCTGILSLPVGALGILFAILTGRKGKKMNPMSRMGIWLSGVGFGIGIFFLLLTAVALPFYLQTEEYIQYRDRLYEQLTGMDYEEFMMENYHIQEGDTQ